MQVDCFHEAVENESEVYSECDSTFVPRNTEVSLFLPKIDDNS